MWKYLQHLTDQIGAFVGNSLHQAGQLLAHFYQVFVRQEIVMGSIGVITGILYLIGAFICYKVGRKIWKSEIEIWDKSVLVVIILLAGLYLANTSIVYLTTWTPHLLNPEYYALQNAINMVRTIK